MNAEIPKGYMEDPKGNLTPVSKVKPQDLLAHDMVAKLIESAQSVSGVLSAFKQTALSEMAAMQDLLDEQYGVARGGKKGNLTFHSFDRKMRVEIAVSDVTHFGPELQSAKQLIDECIEDWAEGSNDNIRVLVNAAFQVNKKGRIDKARVLGLRRLDIDDPRWLRAMDAISDALIIGETRTYIRFYKADPKNGVMKQIPLDMAAM